MKKSSRTARTIAAGGALGVIFMTGGAAVEHGANTQLATHPDYVISQQIGEVSGELGDASNALEHRNAYTTSTYRKVGNVSYTTPRYHPERRPDGGNARTSVGRASTQLGNLSHTGDNAALLSALDTIEAQIPEQNDIEEIDGREVDNDTFASVRDAIGKVRSTLDQRADTFESRVPQGLLARQTGGMVIKFTGAALFGAAMLTAVARRVRDKLYPTW